MPRKNAKNEHTNSEHQPLTHENDLTTPVTIESSDWLDLDGMSNNQLRSVLHSHHLNTRGNKRVLQLRLSKYLNKKPLITSWFWIFMMILRNGMLYSMISWAHNNNFGNYRFWEDYWCNSADYESANYALVVYGIHVLLCWFWAFSKMTGVVFVSMLIWPLMLFFLPIINYDNFGIYHMVLGGATIYFPFLQSFYYAWVNRLFKKPQMKWVLIAFFLIYNTIFIPHAVYMYWSEEFENQPGYSGNWNFRAWSVFFELLGTFCMNISQVILCFRSNLVELKRKSQKQN